MSYAKETAVGFFVAIGLVCVAYLTIKLGRMEIFDAGGYTVSARFASVAGLRVGANVEIAGVPVGKVTEISLDKTTYDANVVLHINKGVALSDDVIASVKTSGLIGDKYIAIAPGGSETTLKQGDTITDTEATLDLESLISKVVFGGV